MLNMVLANNRIAYDSMTPNSQLTEDATKELKQELITQQQQYTEKQQQLAAIPNCASIDLTGSYPDSAINDTFILLAKPREAHI